MPKRKRTHEDTESFENTSNNLPDRALEVQKKQVEQHVTIGKKALNKALKLAKGFERQKLGRRLKEAGKENGLAEITRLACEVEALKELKLLNLAEIHIYKWLSKSKPISSSPGFPDWISSAARRSHINGDSGKPELETARNNVAARLYNSNPVKEVMSDITKAIRRVLGLDGMEEDQKNVRQDHGDIESHVSGSKPLTPADTTTTKPQRDQPRLEASHEEKSSDGFEGFSDPVCSEDEREDEGFSKYDDRIASSPEDEGEEEQNENGGAGGNGNVQRPNRTAQTPYDHEADLSLSSAPSEASPSPPQPSKARGRKTLTSALNSTFLPSLMSGYWSGSESGDDGEVANIPPRKNRMGQQARRQLWEKKYGTKANHLKWVARDKDWDPKRGARPTGGNGEGIWFNKGDAQTAGVKMNYSRSTGAQPGSSGPHKPARVGKKDNDGPLHPSWEAARKAKAEAKQAIFQGKRIVFD